MAAFPELDAHFLRFTLGLRMMVAAVTFSAEGTYYAGQTISGSSAPGAYPTFEVPSSLVGAANLGFGF